MKCWIIYNAFLESEKFIDYARMLQDAAVSRGHEAHILKNSDIMNIITPDAETDTLLINSKPDYVIFTDKDIYLARYLEAQGILVYNPADAIAMSDDKIRTYQQLQQAGIPIPRTIIVPKTFGLTAKLDESFFHQASQVLGLPLVVKEAFGSFGEQVYLANDDEELRQLVAVHGSQPLMLQEFIKTSYGRDIRIQTVGQRVITAMERRATNDFRSNVTAGGSMLPYEPNTQEIEVAVQAVNAIGAHFAGVDLLFGSEGMPIVCEVNANAHIRNLLDCTGVNVAHDIILYIENHAETRDL